MPARIKLIAAISSLSVVGGAAVAAAAEPVAQQITPVSADAKLIERPGDRLRDSIQAHRELERLRDAYGRLVEQAATVGIDVGGPSADNLTSARLEDEIDRLREEIRKAEDASTIAGVPRSTLEAIAACESGGDPTAVSSDGSFRGKYQFDRGTWASVGGSGDPAAAPEAEQDYRAALLYSRSSSSPWPICG